jgi:hypothetical protein
MPQHIVDKAAKLAKDVYNLAKKLYNKIKEIAMKGVRWVENQIKKMKNVAGKMNGRRRTNMNKVPAPFPAPANSKLTHHIPGVDHQHRQDRWLHRARDGQGHLRPR